MGKVERLGTNARNLFRFPAATSWFQFKTSDRNCIIIVKARWLVEEERERKRASPSLFLSLFLLYLWIPVSSDRTIGMQISKSHIDISARYLIPDIHIRLYGIYRGRISILCIIECLWKHSVTSFADARKNPLESIQSKTSVVQWKTARIMRVRALSCLHSQKVASTKRHFH